MNNTDNLSQANVIANNAQPTGASQPVAQPVPAVQTARMVQTVQPVSVGQPVVVQTVPTAGAGQMPTGYVPVYTQPAQPPALGKSKRRLRLDETVKDTNCGLLALLCLLFGVLYSRLIFQGGFGLGVTAVTVLFYALFSAFIVRKGKKISLWAYLLMIPTAAIALAFSVFAGTEGRGVMVISMIMMFMLQTTAMSGCTAAHPLSGRGAADSLVTHLFTWAENIAGTLSGIFRSGKEKGEKKKVLSGNVGKVIIGLLISLPVVFILLIVLSSADAAFAMYVEDAFDKLLGLDLDGLLLDIFLGVLLCFYFAPLVMTLRSSMPTQRKTSERKRFLDPIIGATVSFAAASVFVLFILVQFKYFFALQMHDYFGYDFDFNLKLPHGMTWAEYARSGFMELSGVVIGTFLFITFFVGLSKRSEKGSLAMPLRIALTLLAVCNVFLSASAVLRMCLYIKYCGLTVKRLGVLFIIAVLTLCLAAAVIKIWAYKFRMMRAVMIIFVCAACVFSFMNAERLCAKVNVDRHLENGTSIDIEYIGQLSYGAAPEVERLLESEDINVRRAAKGILCKYTLYGAGKDYYPEENTPLGETKFGAWTLDHYRAEKICEKYGSIPKAYLDDYGLLANYQIEKRNYERWSDDEFMSFEEYKKDHYYYDYATYGVDYYY